MSHVFTRHFFLIVDNDEATYNEVRDMVRACLDDGGDAAAVEIVLDDWACERCELDCPGVFGGSSLANELLTCALQHVDYRDAARALVDELCEAGEYRTCDGCDVIEPAHATPDQVNGLCADCAGES